MLKMAGLTTITFFKFHKNKFWAFSQMALLPRKIKKIEGLRFFKLMGTGGGNGFSLKPDFSTYAFLGVWESEIAAENFLIIMIKLIVMKINQTYQEQLK